MELWTVREVADKLGLEYGKIYYLINGLGLAKQQGESIRTEAGTLSLITDKGFTALKDYIEAEARLIARRPKSFGDQVYENQKKANAELTKQVWDALPKKELELVQNRIANMKNEGKDRMSNPAFAELKKQEAKLLKRLGK